MVIKDIVAQIDAGIASLRQARTGSANLAKHAKKKRNLTPEGRARIAEAVKRRWAKQKAIVKRNGKA